MNPVKKEDLKVGLLVWWTAERYMRGWDCPCVVTYVNHEKNHYKIFSFDDCKESGDLLIERPEGGDKSSLTEMRICDTEEVGKYFKNKRYKETPAAMVKRILGKEKKKKTSISI